MKTTRNIRVTGEEKIGVVNVSFNFEYQGDIAPMSIPVEGRYEADGITSSLRRTYTKTNGAVGYVPVQSNPSFPYDEAFNTDLMVLMENVFDNYKTI